MNIDTRYAYLEDAKGNKYQVLQPVKYVDIIEWTEEGEQVTNQVELPREWDEAATYAAMAKANAK